MTTNGLKYLYDVTFYSIYSHNILELHVLSRDESAAEYQMTLTPP